MSEHSARAVELFKSGYNCSQAVLAAYCDKTGMDFEQALKLSSSFGGGMGRLREVCGAVSGMFMIAGLTKGYTDPTDDNGKAAHYQLIQDLAGMFKARCGSIICRELLQLAEGADKPVPEKRSEQYYIGRPCVQLVEIAAEIIDEEL